MMKNNIKRAIYSAMAMILTLCTIQPITALAADAEFRMMHGEQDAIVVGTIEEVGEQGCLIEVEHVITCKVENTLNRQLPAEEIPGEMLVKEIRYQYSYHTKNEPETGDFVVISVDKAGDVWEQVWLALEVSSTDIATLETAQPKYMTNSEYAWQLFIRSDGVTPDFAYDGMDLYADGELVFDYIEYYKSIKEAAEVQTTEAQTTEAQEQTTGIHAETESQPTEAESYATSIGIIGGADGPTSIFLAGKISPSFGTGIAIVPLVIALLVALAGIIVGVVVGIIIKKK